MYGLAVAGMMGSGFFITLAECFVFSSLIVAVDPVAVRRRLFSPNSLQLSILSNCFVANRLSLSVDKTSDCILGNVMPRSTMSLYGYVI